MAFIKKHSIVFYFVLAYVIAWGGALLIALPKITKGIPLELSDNASMFLPMLLGPSLSGIILTGVLEGKKGIKALFSQMSAWRKSAGWYGVALLTIPVLALIVLVSLSMLASPDLKPSFVPIGLIIGAFAGFFEEIGWTGFALRKMKEKRSVFMSAVIIGVLWGAWHLLVDYFGTYPSYGVWWMPNFLFLYFFPLIAYRVLISWVYNNTSSLLLAQLMHAFYSGVLFMLSPDVNVTHGQAVLWKACLTILIWVFTFFVVRRYGRNLKREI